MLLHNFDQNFDDNCDRNVDSGWSRTFACLELFGSLREGGPRRREEAISKTMRRRGGNKNKRGDALDAFYAFNVLECLAHSAHFTHLVYQTH